MQDLPGPAILKTICETPLLANVSGSKGRQEHRGKQDV